MVDEQLPAVLTAGEKWRALSIRGALAPASTVGLKPPIDLVLLFCPSDEADGEGVENCPPPAIVHYSLNHIRLRPTIRDAPSPYNECPPSPQSPEGASYGLRPFRGLHGEGVAYPQGVALRCYRAAFAHRRERSHYIGGNVPVVWRERSHYIGGNVPIVWRERSHYIDGNVPIVWRERSHYIGGNVPIVWRERSHYIGGNVPVIKAGVLCIARGSCAYEPYTPARPPQANYSLFISRRERISRQGTHGARQLITHNSTVRWASGSAPEGLLIRLIIVIFVKRLMLFFYFFRQTAFIFLFFCII